ncbi:adenosine deaminase-like [Littorina saxatilis]|uniref:Adenosine deaminase n=1 Tax=Littorina saxatilis TaxID=31220 RepID=A0AAN9AQW2_9CAEN
MDSAASITREDILKQFPIKVELHVHLEGAVRLETILDLGRQKKIDLPAGTVDELKKYVCVYKASDLTKALENFYIFGPTFAGYHEGVYRVAYEFCEDAAKQGVRYSEVRYSPHFLSNSLGVQTYAASTGGSYTPRDVVTSVNQGLADGGKKFGVTVRSILCCVRHHPEWSYLVVELCKEFAAQGVVAMDIAGPEIGSIVTDTDQSLHLAAYKKANTLGVKCIAHAGEVGPAEMVRMSVYDYGARRVGHGYRCEEDEELFQRVVKDGVHFETCPISSLKTGGAPNGLDKHPIVKMAKDGASFSINSDDPTLFDNTLSDDYICALKMGLTKQDIVKSIFNAVKASFASDAEKQQLFAELQAAYGDQ